MVPRKRQLAPLPCRIVEDNPTSPQALNISVLYAYALARQSATKHDTGPYNITLIVSCSVFNLAASCFTAPSTLNFTLPASGGD
ncbi:hypothetical protein V6N13_096269 [Hibiscus sabdariffa]|uniref:Uncharacterized protein n=1 Tax=Hibiscus sabdariffa TaxID=183260 RepID=A0ABR2DG68_9ROSI